MAADGFSERFQQGRRFADPVGQGRAVEVEPFAAEDLALPIEWQVVGIFVDQRMGQKARAGATTFDGAGRQWSLHKPFTTGAGQPGPDDPVHEEAAGHILQLLGDILPDPAQATTTVGTGNGAWGQFNLHARDVVRDRTALGFVLLLDVGQLHPRGHCGGSNLAGLKCQLQLLGRLG